MAAYASLVSLFNIMEQIQNHPHHSISFDKNQIESLRDKVCFLLDFMETHSHGVITKETQVLESQITSAAYAAEDVIESHVVDQIHAGLISSLDLQTVIRDMDSIKNEIMQSTTGEVRSRDLQHTYSMPSTQPRRLTTNNKQNTVIGFDQQLIQLMDKLTGQPSNGRIIPIVGMGGIGKTTLAKHAYEHSLVVQHFDIRTWVTVSQKYVVRELLLQLLSWQSNRDGEMDRETDQQLAEKLHKKLWGRRYLIVVDDVWSIEAWEKLSIFFPNNDNGSRIVVTTRISDLAIYFNSPCLELTFLDEDKSWKLFCEKAFDQACCSPELEDISKVIVKKCKGLPLSIVVIGGLLRRSTLTQEYWKSIAKEFISVLNSGEEEDEHCLSILSLSYIHLSAHLKPCFLYLGFFSEDHEIRVSELVRLWIAEGFIKPKETQSLEMIARGYLNDLIGRNLILKHGFGSNGETRTCKIHDLLRDLCLKVAHEDKFMCTMKDIPRGIDRERRVIFHEQIPKEEYHSLVFPALFSASVARTLLLSTVGPLPFNNRLLRILNVDDECVAEESNLPKGIFDQVNLRYLAYAPYPMKYSRIFDKLPSKISLFWNMQTLIIGALIFAPSQIWEMRQLRHVHVHLLILPDPTQSDVFVLRNLQKLKRVVNMTWSEDVCKRIINVQKLNLIYDDDVEWGRSDDYRLYNLGRLHKLESLTCTNFQRDNLLHDLAPVSSLRKLSLTNCNARWEDLTAIGLLPNLEVLKLEMRRSMGDEWNPVEGEFVRLKFLLISENDVVYWNADSCHFPVLEKLVLFQLSKLSEVPCDFGEIPTLEVIRVDWCSVSAAISAMRIAEEQENAGNDGLQVHVEFKHSEQVENFWGELEESERFTRNNFRVKAHFP